jgi:CRISPR-associated protein Csm1
MRLEKKIGAVVMNKKVILAALLHDIGKLVMRAEGFRQNHSLTGVEYLERFNNELFNDRDILESVKYHHARQLNSANLASNNIAYIIYEADNIASGADRREDIEREEIEYKSKWDKFDKNQCLKPVFNLIKNRTDYVFCLRDLEDEYPNYPTNNVIAPKEKYMDLRVWLDKNLANITNANSLLQLLESTMTFVPSSTNVTEIVDVSLYAHSKLTGAIASCMYEYFVASGVEDFRDKCFNSSKIEQNRKDNYFKLVSFDMSGIQNFIYTIASKDALKSLRARSFYLEFLMEHIQDELLEKLELSRANILYSGGGHSYLLLPNTDKVNSVLAELSQKVNNWLFDKFSTELYLAYAQVDCSSDDLMNSKTIFKELTKRLSKSKLQRYTEEQLERIFELDKNSGDERECEICKKSGILDSENTCEFCNSLISLGGYLVKDNDFIIVVSDEKREYSIELPSLSDEKKYFNVELNKKISSEESKRYYAINKFSSGDYYATNIWMGDYCKHKEDGSAYCFDDYSKQTEGIKRIAVLRADVDNLGSTFAGGFGKYSTISRYATLSMTLNLFFKHYINSIAKNKNIAIVYSGGDDVFVVGGWSDVLSFGKELREAFYKYSCEKLTLSAGIGMFSSKYPISKMAELTETLEGFAKSNNDNTKDSIALFGENRTKKEKDVTPEQFVFTWEEFDKILELQKYIEDRCYFDEEDVVSDKVFFSTALIYRIMTLINSSDEINLARFAYTLARMENKSCEGAFEELKKKLYNAYNDETERKKLLVALNLIVYKNREKY